ncbi:hypothetical protein WICPIJ_010061 [Wickerhamomyces pijperi]|uniref:Uncharacterized protein n=1 Tax=Wickerhamomyces pijperi TaxID=599730 RepID=A0A9P8TAX3_WICPI|nr:hypothetical protein WICPIJ_010061 [Wickerhamomyces pijperi]
MRHLVPVSDSLPSQALGELLIHEEIQSLHCGSRIDRLVDREGLDDFELADFGKRRGKPVNVLSVGLIRDQDHVSWFDRCQKTQICSQVSEPF